MHPGVYVEIQKIAKKARECTEMTSTSELKAVRSELQANRPNHVRADSEVMALWKDAVEHINNLLPEHKWYQRPIGLIGIGVFIVIVGACAVKIFDL